MTKFGGDLVKKEMSLGERAKQLFDNQETNHPSGRKPVWKDQPEDIQDIWLRKAVEFDTEEESSLTEENGDDDPALNYLEKTIHLTIHITGDSADEINYLNVLQEYINDMNFTSPVKITSGNQNTYYTEKK